MTALPTLSCTTALTALALERDRPQSWDLKDLTRCVFCTGMQTLGYLVVLAGFILALGMHKLAHWMQHAVSSFCFLNLERDAVALPVQLTGT